MAVKNPPAPEAPAGYAKGLEGVVVCQSRLCQIDGQEGKLFYAGYPIEELAKGSSFEEVCFLLWKGRLPSAAELRALEAEFLAERVLPAEVLEFMKKVPAKAHPMEGLRTVVSLLQSVEKIEGAAPEAQYRRAVSVTAKIPAVIAGLARLRKGEAPVAPHKSLGHAANFLYMLHGKEPEAAAAKVLDLALVLHADHEMNASTFSALVTASTLSDLYSAVVSGIGTLKGPLHGGANEVVLQMLQEIGGPDKVEAYLDLVKSDKKKRVMGFGHRVYKAYDPRARILKEQARELSKGTKFELYFDTNDKLEAAMKARYGEKGIFPNVDLYSGIVYTQMGIPTDVFTPIFAMSRVSGWTAHVLEYWQDNRLFRPNADYIGEGPRAYVSIDKR